MSEKLDPDSFIQMIAPSAKPICQDYGVRASVFISQCALESGWNSSTIGQFNFFGMKWSGKGPYLEENTQEEENGVMVDTVAKFQDYTSMDEAVKGYCIDLTQNEVYADAIAAKDDLHDYVIKLAAHYATDESYAGTVLEIINEFGLEEYDAE